MIRIGDGFTWRWTAGCASKGSMPRLLAACTLLGAGTLSACGSTDDRSVTVTGDVEGLDSLGYRGDSLLAQADRAPLVIDSLRAAARAEIDSVAKDNGNSVATRSDERARQDSVRGQLVWDGTGASRSVVLRASGYSTPVELSGLGTTGMSKLVGAEVVVRGVRVTARDIVVSEFFVRAADGVPAFDGVVQANGTLLLSDGSGVKRVPLPAALQGMHGARVWIAVKDNQPHAFGLIAGR